jgi:hypothetical protein
MFPPHDYNFITQLWEKMTSNIVLVQWSFERFKLVSLYMVMILGIMKDDWTSPTFRSLRTSFEIILQFHLDPCEDVCSKLVFAKGVSLALLCM